MKDTIASWLITHAPYLKQHVLNDLIEQRKNLLANEDRVLYDDINKEFNILIRSKLNEEISKSLGVSTEDASLVTEDLNIQEYLK